MTPTTPLPKEVQQQLDDIRDAGITIEPTVEQTSPRTWEVRLTTPRVTATAEFRRSPTGRVYYNGGHLTVDGNPAEPADLPELARILANPGGEPVDTIDPMPPARTPSEAPPTVQQAYWSMVRRVTGATIQLGYDECARTWIIDIALQHPRSALRHIYRRTGKAQWGKSVLAIINGVDRSFEAANNIETALGLFHDEHPTTSSGPTTGGHGTPADGAGFGAVEVRRHTVIRT